MSSTRLTADARREAVLAAALPEFAAKGYAGTATEAVARRAGISQPYVFRLFPSKRDLFLALVERCFAQVGASLHDGGGGTSRRRSSRCHGRRLWRAARRS